jgi:hypothetical protein
MFKRLPFRQEYHGARPKKNPFKKSRLVFCRDAWNPDRSLIKAEGTSGYGYVYYVHASIVKAGGPTDNPLRACGFITAPAPNPACIFFYPQQLILLDSVVIYSYT